MGRRDATGVRLLVGTLYYDLNFLLFSVYNRHQRLASSPQLRLWGTHRDSGIGLSMKCYKTSIRGRKTEWCRGWESVLMSAVLQAPDAGLWAFILISKRHTREACGLPNHLAPFIRIDAARNTPWPAEPVGLPPVPS
jgi:hypothetical protein